MRRYVLSALLLILVATLTTVLLSSPAFADSYTIYHVGNGNSESTVLLTSGGVAVLYGADNCGTPYCYSTYTMGTLTSTSLTAPTLTDDNGSACAPAVPAGYVGAGGGMCNGAFAATGADLLAGGHTEVFGGRAGALSALHTDNAYQLAVDSLGDILWLDPNSENNYEAFDLTTRAAPEPSSLALLGTGVLGLTGAVQRRRVRR